MRKINKHFGFASLIAIALCLPACSDWETFEDVSSRPNYQKIVGSQYEVIGSVTAFGIRKTTTAQASYITLLPNSYITGWEVAFDLRIEPTSKIIVKKVLASNRLSFDNITFEVEVIGTPLPKRVPVRIDVNLNNKGETPLSLNGRLYRKL